MLIRPMTLTDLPGVLAVQQRCYAPAFHEPAVAFASKLSGSPGTCWVATRAPGTSVEADVQAYLVCLPVDADSLPALHAPRWHPPASAQALYLHDLAVSPAAQGQALAPRLVAQAREQAREMGLSQMVLVAVQGSEGFWQRQGFAERPLPEGTPADKLASFGAGARFMACTV